MNIRYNFADYDGDGDDEEGVAIEIADLRDALYAACRPMPRRRSVRASIYNDARLSVLLRRRQR